MAHGRRTPEVERARAEQLRLAPVVETADRMDEIRLVAGVDCGFEDKGAITRAAVVLMRFPELEPVDQVLVRLPTRFPYIPGYLSFRELPAISEALKGLSHKPDLVMCDGQGIAHPRRFGIACHLGVSLDLPSIGVAKSRLTGTHEEPGPFQGDRAPLLDEQGQHIGYVLRSRDKVRPLFVSPGHRVGIQSACRITLACCAGFRLPEPIRSADKLASNRL